MVVVQLRRTSDRYGYDTVTGLMSLYRQRAFNRSRRPLAMTADIPLMLAPPGEPTEHVCKLHGVATTGAGGQGQYGYTHVWQLRAAPDLAPAGPGLTSAGEYQATAAAAADGGLDATARQHDGVRTFGRRDHLYDCPLFDDRLLTRLQTGSHTHSPGCRRHQVKLSRDSCVPRKTKAELEAASTEKWKDPCRHFIFVILTPK